MWYKIRINIAAILLCIGSLCSAQSLSDSAYISLLTCAPGNELYARFGHTALRVCDPVLPIDLTFNYGIFDFNTDHFYWKFVRGETWYELGVTPTWWFMKSYREEHRPVYEQRLNLTAEERDTIWQALRKNYLPENRKYLYNFVYDNCATRPYYLILHVIGDTIHSNYTGYTGLTYRQFIRHYTGAHTWANAGINLLFGSKADQAMSSEQRLFLPEELMLYMNIALRRDWKPMVVQSTATPFVIPSTPWYASWEFGLSIYVLFLVLFSIRDRKRQKWSWGIEVFFGIPYVLLLLIVGFLTFFSCHPLVGFGWRLLIIPITHLCTRLIYIIR